MTCSLQHHTGYTTHTLSTHRLHHAHVINTGYTTHTVSTHSLHDPHVTNTQVTPHTRCQHTGYTTAHTRYKHTPATQNTYTRLQHHRLHHKQLPTHTCNTTQVSLHTHTHTHTHYQHTGYTHKQTSYFCAMGVSVDFISSRMRSSLSGSAATTFSRVGHSGD